MRNRNKPRLRGQTGRWRLATGRREKGEGSDPIKVQESPLRVARVTRVLESLSRSHLFLEGC
eukprot:scaffold93285_cov21-Tisochrysis_lutea.AAC.1